MARSRTKAGSVGTMQVSWKKKNSLGNETVLIAPYTAQTDADYQELIIDEVSSGHFFNNCEHSKIVKYRSRGVMTGVVSGETHEIEGFAARITDATGGIRGGGAQDYVVPNHLNPYSVEPSEDVRSRAFYEMLPAINKDISLVNSLLELKDLRSLYKQGQRIVKTLRSMEQRIVAFNLANYRSTPLQQALKRHGLLLTPGGAVRKTAKAASESYLALKFAIEPLVRDVNALLTINAKARSEARRIRSLLGRPVRAHWGTYLLQDEEYSHQQLSGGNTFLQSYNQKVTSRFTATAIMSVSIPADVEKNLERLALLDLLGLQLAPSVVWNAIPFSFVVDWFVNVGDLLQRTVDQRHVTPTVAIHDYCDSVRTEWIAERGFNYTLDQQKHVVATDHVVLYKRGRRVPSANLASVKITGLSRGEFSLTLALFGARIKPRPRGG